MLANRLRLELDYATARAAHLVARQNEYRIGVEANVDWVETHCSAELYGAVPEFFVERLKVQQREAGIRHDLIDAVFKLKQRKDEIVGNLARVHALQDFVGTEDGVNLLAGYKRAANILKKEDWAGSTAAQHNALQHTGDEDPLENVEDADMRHVYASAGYEPEPAERSLRDALDKAEPLALQAVETEDFASAMSALATLRGPIDAFFQDVIVNDSDPLKRNARLDLLDRFRIAVHNVADFSKIEG